MRLELIVLPLHYPRMKTQDHGRGPISNSADSCLLAMVTKMVLLVVGETTTSLESAGRSNTDELQEDNEYLATFTKVQLMNLTRGSRDLHESVKRVVIVRN